MRDFTYQIDDLDSLRDHSAERQLDGGMPWPIGMAIILASGAAMWGLVIWGVVAVLE